MLTDRRTDLGYLCEVKRSRTQAESDPPAILHGHRADRRTPYFDLNIRCATHPLHEVGYVLVEPTARRRFGPSEGCDESAQVVGGPRV